MGDEPAAKSTERPAARRSASARVEGKRKEKRLRILESAVRSFAKRGFFGTSMDDIAEDLLLTRGSLYYYYRDKEEILALCHEVALEAVNDVLDRVRAAGLPPEAAVRRLVVEHTRIMVDKFHGTVLALEFDALDAKRRAAVVEARDRFERGLREVIEEGIRKKVFRRVDPKMTSFAIFGAINWVARWYRPGGGSSPDEIGEAFADLFLGGMLARKGGERA
ncbi:MAG TPA: TetR/AcrR family transcriptional regulator [Thermoanaerobaculia bacterium]|nr:TetR/AcrR family transcriptional regulator [Thermoanaerobaculia bacterium]